MSQKIEIASRIVINPDYSVAIGRIDGKPFVADEYENVFKLFTDAGVDSVDDAMRRITPDTNFGIFSETELDRMGRSDELDRAFELEMDELRRLSVNDYSRSC